MKDPSGDWVAPPPSYDPIVAEGKKVVLTNTRSSICNKIMH